MKLRLKVGLGIAAISVLPSFFITFFGCLFPCLLLFIGAWAAYLTILLEKPPSRDRGAGAGAVAAGIAGIGPLAAVLVFVSLNSVHVEIPTDPSILAGRAIALAQLSLLLLPFAVAGGAITGYLATPAQRQSLAKEQQSEH